MIELRDYQIKAVSDLCDAYLDNCNAVVQLPTGTGKTTVICEFIRQWRNRLDPNKRVLVIAHRIELIDQIRDRLLSFGIKSGKIKSGERVSEEFQVQVGLIQSLRSDNKKPKTLGLIIVDEAHHITAQSYKNLIDYYQIYQPKVFGFTATPSRLDGSALGDIFSHLFEYGQVQEFIDKKYLSPVKHYATSNPNLDEIKIKATGDYSESELLEKMSESKIMADLLKGYQDNAKGKKAIVFCVNSEHARIVAERYNKYGYKAVAMDYTTPAELRKENLLKFKNNELLILCNVNLFTEGFDCPDVEVVQLARPTKSLNLYLQMVGRAMRTAPNKTHGIILDNAMLWEEHGLSTRDREWNLSGLAKSKVKIVVTEKVDNNNKTEKEAKIPTESSSYELVEIIQSEIIETDDPIISLLALPITLIELVKYLRFQGYMNNQRILNETLSIEKFDHYLLDREFNLFDVLAILGIELNKNQKSYSVNKIIKKIQEFITHTKDIDMWSKRHYAYLNVCYWSDFEFFKTRNIAKKTEFLKEMKTTQLIKVWEFFSVEKVFDDLFNENDVLSKGLEEMNIEFVHQLKERIVENYAERISTRLKYIFNN